MTNQILRNTQVLIAISSLEIVKVQCYCGDSGYSRCILYVDSLDELIVASKEIECGSVYALQSWQLKNIKEV